MQIYTSSVSTHMGTTFLSIVIWKYHCAPPLFVGQYRNKQQYICLAMFLIKVYLNKIQNMLLSFYH